MGKRGKGPEVEKMNPKVNHGSIMEINHVNEVNTGTTPLTCPPCSRAWGTVDVVLVVALCFVPTIV